MTISTDFTPLSVRKAVEKTQLFFQNHQQGDGHWVAELEGDVLLESETILLLAWLKELPSDIPANSSDESEHSENAECPDILNGPDLVRKCAAYLLEKQLDGGGWEMYPDAGPDVTNSVKAYFALKLAGEDPASEPMRRARLKILELGGADKVNSFTRFYLALLGQIPYDRTPAVPPQMLMLSGLFPVNIYSMSSWSRTIFVPLSIVSALQPVRELPVELGIRELFIENPALWKPTVCPGMKSTFWSRSWTAFFQWGDRFIRRCRQVKFTPFRKRGIRKAQEWLLAHCKRSDGPGAIYPPIVWGYVALKTLGYADNSPEILNLRRQLADLVIEEKKKGTARLQPCKSPVWDTSLTLKSLLLSGLTREHPTVEKGLQWLVEQQTLVPGDWRHRVHARPGGWAFEYHNEYYPDCDDTAMALMVLAGDFSDTAGVNRPVKSPDEPDAVFLQKTEDEKRRSKAVERGLAWLLRMQNRDGSWAAFDRNNSLKILCHVPFADHNAMIDPGTPDLTGRVMESLGRLGHQTGVGKKNIDRVVRYMKRSQQADGSWFGRWGVNHLYGTWQALTGLAAVGVPASDKAVQWGMNWLITHQQSDGGWGESPDSYKILHLRGHGKSTASQTAWAVMGLIAAGQADHPATRRGIEYLLKNQNEDGTWSEKEFTGTGFPQVFYLKYHYYPVYFPLMALSLYLSHTEKENGRDESDSGSFLPSGPAPTEEELVSSIMEEDSLSSSERNCIAERSAGTVGSTGSVEPADAAGTTSDGAGFLPVLYQEEHPAPLEKSDHIYSLERRREKIPFFGDRGVFSIFGIFPLGNRRPASDSIRLSVFDPESERNGFPVMVYPFGTLDFSPFPEREEPVNELSNHPVEFFPLQLYEDKPQLRVYA